MGPEEENEGMDTGFDDQPTEHEVDDRVASGYVENDEDEPKEETDQEQ